MDKESKRQALVDSLGRIKPKIEVVLANPSEGQRGGGASILEGAPENLPRIEDALESERCIWEPD
jgi:hypothetical protein